MDDLLKEIRKCRVCEKFLPPDARPVVAAGKSSKIVIIGQAPGRIVNQTGIPWDDKSGDNLRDWMGVDRETFYDTNQIALVPMGFCYPGKGKSGDLPPRPECAPLWHSRLLEYMPNLRMTILTGAYSQKYYLKGIAGKNLTETVKNFQACLPKYFPLPHPSPRNFIWQAKNQWFAKDALPELKKRIAAILA